MKSRILIDKTMKTKLFYILIAVVLVGIGSCKKDKDSDPGVCATAWAVSTQDELTAVVNAALVWSTSPTVANCNAYKTAAQTYLNALKPYESCASLTANDKQNLQEAIQEAQADINSLTCQ